MLVEMGGPVGRYVCPASVSAATLHHERHAYRRGHTEVGHREHVTHATSGRALRPEGEVC